MCWVRSPFGVGLEVRAESDRDPVALKSLGGKWEVLELDLLGLKIHRGMSSRVGPVVEWEFVVEAVVVVSLERVESLVPTKVISGRYA